MKGEEMGYINANDILPKELVNEIQKCVQGVNLYIPKILEKKETDSSYKKELYERNKEIYEKFQSGNTVSELAKMYYLSEKRIQIYKLLYAFVIAFFKKSCYNIVFIASVYDVLVCSNANYQSTI